MEYYDKAYDRVNVKSEKPLKRIDRVFHTVTTTDDPVIRLVITQLVKLSSHFNYINYYFWAFKHTNNLN